MNTNWVGLITLETDNDFRLEVMGQQLHATKIRVARPTEAEVLQASQDFLNQIKVAGSKYDDKWVDGYQVAINECAQDLAEKYNAFDKLMGNHAVSFRIIQVPGVIDNEEISI